VRQACDVPYGHAGSESGVGERGLIGGRRLSAVLGGALGRRRPLGASRKGQPSARS
jgi:hypothetical protein